MRTTRDGHRTIVRVAVAVAFVILTVVSVAGLSSAESGPRGLEPTSPPASVASISATTVPHLLVEGDRAQSVDTTTTESPGDEDDGLSAEVKLWMVIGGLVAVAVLIGLLSGLIAAAAYSFGVNLAFFEVGELSSEGAVFTLGALVGLFGMRFWHKKPEEA